ncbi:response regulator transcription factor [Brevundimonas subvibrioides]|uniref:response regulator transcription factor n=1 Tax=Brevundimonas subvibrioides TaxID=74313 RepID=UPI0022B4DEFE|nr:response regulator transcription factor [Brevundimonas subvibrioides]
MTPGSRIRLVSAQTAIIALVRKALQGSACELAVERDEATSQLADVDLVIADARAWPEAQTVAWMTATTGPRLVIVDDLSSPNRAVLRTLREAEVVFSDVQATELRTRVEALLQRTSGPSLLLVEDEPRLADQIATLIGSAGYGVSVVGTIAAAAEAVAARPFDILVLDRGLPDGDGLLFLKRLRAEGTSTPALILSAWGETVQRIDGLRGGANDYMVKPFEPDELLARIEVLVRPVLESDLQRIGALELQRNDRIARWKGRRIDLTDTEFRLLAYMAGRPGLVLPASMLRSDVWDIRRQHTETNIVAAGIRRLRRKLEEAGTPEAISTHSQGYRFDLQLLLAAGDG